MKSQVKNHLKNNLSSHVSVMQFAVTVETYAGTLETVDNLVEICNGLIESLKEDKNYNTYTDLEYNILALNNSLSDLFLYFFEEKRKLADKMKQYGDKEKDNHKSIASLDKAIDYKFSMENDREASMKNILECYKSKKTGIDRFASHMKDYFFYDQQGAQRTQ